MRQLCATCRARNPGSGSAAHGSTVCATPLGTHSNAGCRAVLANHSRPAVWRSAHTQCSAHARGARATTRLTRTCAGGKSPGLYLSICLSGDYRSVITSHAWQVVVGLLSLGSKSHHASAHRAPCRLDVRGGRRKAQRPGTSARTSTDLLGRACDPAGSDRLPGADQHHDPVSR